MSNESAQQSLVDEIKSQVAKGAAFIEIIDLIHEAMGVAKYNRGIVMKPLYDALGLRAADFTTVVFACEIFGDGATVSVADTERAFRRLLNERRSGEG